ncbi:MAG TPA: hypothetical protein VF006_23160 [Longimicrobium sp.]
MAYNWFNDADIEKLALRVDELEKNLAPGPADPKLPNILDAKNGIASARSALDLFRQGRDLEGTAQVFAAVGSLGTFVSGFSTALGPAGALLGLVTGVISAIITAIVGPQTDSMLAKIGQMFVDQSLKEDLSRLNAAGQVGRTSRPTSTISPATRPGTGGSGSGMTSRQSCSGSRNTTSWSRRCTSSSGRRAATPRRGCRSCRLRRSSADACSPAFSSFAEWSIPRTGRGTSTISAT